MAWYTLFIMTGYEYGIEREISRYMKIDGLHPFVPIGYLDQSYEMKATIEITITGATREVTVSLEIVEKLPKGSIFVLSGLLKIYQDWFCHIHDSYLSPAKLRFIV